jgi:hypothetical protein
MKFINLTEKEMEDIERAVDERLETLQEELMREKKKPTNQTISRT